MIRFTIDGKQAAVEPGTTVLEAARQIGIEIPTLCYVKELDPAASCFLCAVQVEGRPNLSPSCALPAAEGMVVATNSEDIRQARRMALELLLSDHAGDCVAPCQARCPAGLDIAGFVYELADGKPERSLEIIFESLALPGSLGRVCPRLCETGCRRCELDEGLAIGALHRYPVDLRDADSFSSTVKRAPDSGKRVAIVGAGPAGLAAAFYLQQQGHQCTIYDAQDEPGGMLRYGIPAYRLPVDALQAEIQVIRELGATFKMGARWGSDFHLDDLTREHDAVFIAIGAWRSQLLRCEGDQLALPGIGMLEQVARGQRPDLGSDVIVIGGGNTAMDAARTALRLGADRVRTLYRRTRQEMPCLMEEVEGAELEGIEIEYLVAPVKLERNGPNLLLTCQKMTLGEPDSSGRRRPVPVPGSEYQIECTAVIAAVGQSVDTSLAQQEGLEVSGWGIASNPTTLETSLPGVFAGGDAVLGADLAVRAVAAGRLAAASINQLLDGKPVVGLGKMTNVEMRAVTDEERAALFRAIESSPKPQTKTIDLERRVKTFDEIDQGLTPEQVDRESRRCMTCGCRKAGSCIMRQYATDYEANPYRFSGERRRFAQDTTHPDIIYEPGKCILCDACVRIAAAAGEELGVAAVGRGFQVAMGVPFNGPLSAGLAKAAIRAVEACPTGALALRSGRSCDLGECDSCPK